MIDHTAWPAEPEIALDLRNRLIEDRSLIVEFLPEAPSGGAQIQAPVVEIRDEIEEGDLEYSAPLLIGQICKILHDEPFKTIRLGPVDVDDGIARVVVELED